MLGLTIQKSLEIRRRIYRLVEYCINNKKDSPPIQRVKFGNILDLELIR